jgi:hypothetical protein
VPDIQSEEQKKESELARLHDEPCAPFAASEKNPG